MFVTPAFPFNAAVEKEIAALFSCPADPANTNLTPAQKELLLWHYRLGHFGMDSIKQAMKRGVLATTRRQRKLHAQIAKDNFTNPTCASCCFSKARRRSTGAPTTSPEPPSITKGHLLPGQCASVDHFICSQRGRPFDGAGKPIPSKQYAGGAIFVDHATGFVFVHFQTTMNTIETLKGKHDFEARMAEFGYTVQEYRLDLATAFTSAEFTTDLARNRQITRFAGVGGHHHNPIAERCIQTVSSAARTALLHQSIRWPEITDVGLWPQAVEYSVDVHNHLPRRDNGLSPLEMLSKTHSDPSHLQNFHVWGCPLYVLDPNLADGQRIPRWNPRSRRGVFLGLSPRHATSVPRVLNLQTGRISNQFHVMFDDQFATVSTDVDIPVDLQADPIWKDLFSGSRFQYPLDADDAVQIVDRMWEDESSAAVQRNAAQLTRYYHPTPTPTRNRGSSVFNRGSNVFNRGSLCHRHLRQSRLRHHPRILRQRPFPPPFPLHLRRPPLRLLRPRHRTFLRRHLSAVTFGLTPPLSTGPNENDVLHSGTATSRGALTGAIVGTSPTSILPTTFFSRFILTLLATRPLLPKLMCLLLSSKRTTDSSGMTPCGLRTRTSSRKAPSRKSVRWKSAVPGALFPSLPRKDTR